MEEIKGLAAAIPFSMDEEGKVNCEKGKVREIMTPEEFGKTFLTYQFLKQKEGKDPSRNGMDR